MTVSEVRVIDFVAHDPTRDEVLLVMVEDRPWQESGELLPELQTKLDTYLQYVTGGKLSNDFPELTGKPVHVQLRATSRPGVRELELLRLASESHFRPAGIKVSWRETGQASEHERPGT